MSREDHRRKRYRWKTQDFVLDIVNFRCLPNFRHLSGEVRQVIRGRDPEFR